MGVFSTLSVERRREITGIGVLAATAIVFLALATDEYQGETSRSITDLGAGGTMLAGLLYLLLGRAAHLIYILTGAWGVMLLRHQAFDRIWSRLLGFFLVVVSMAGFFQAAFDAGQQPGGMAGQFIVSTFRNEVGIGGLIVSTLTVAAVGLLLSTEFLFVKLLHRSWATLLLVLKSIDTLRQQWMASLSERRERRAQEATVIDVKPARKKKSTKKAPTVHTDSEPKTNWFREILGTLSTKKRKVRAAVKRVQRAHGDEETALERIEPRVVVSSSDPDAGAEDFDEEDAWYAEEPETEAVTARADTAEQLELTDEDAAAVYVSSRPEPKSDPARVPDKARIRRRNYSDELPEDYEYPKRYKKPPLDIFDNPDLPDHGDVRTALKETANHLEETLQTFGIEAQVTDIVRGPSITRFEVEPASGIKVSRFVALADDLALALRAHGVRVEAPIPGKGRVGIEIPNDFSDPVAIRTLLESREFKKADGQLMLTLGKDIAGEVMVADLATMPHLLIAGATGSGKTVFVKNLLASLLASKTPDELQLILVDPKMVELSILNHIPHLITPVVIDPKKAATALTWLIHEMEQRYELFTHLRVRNIEVYNESVENGEIEVESQEGEAGDHVQSIRKLPYIVCVIDELADLMMLARAEVEDAIFRLAQLARAVGIHLVIATQRPSVDVLTGVIKANLPARVSFQVSSRVDSRCILEVIGAERLMGKGDMLYLPPGRGKPMRVQSAFVSDDEMNDLIAYLKSQAPPQYRDEIEHYGKQKDSQISLDDEDDELFDDAVRVVVETGQASISMIQRRLRVGYTRAARLIDMMELKGIVGPHVGSKAREILVPTQSQEDEVA